MPDLGFVAKAELREIKDLVEINPDRNLAVQFNPETLKVSFANQLPTSAGAGDQNGPPTRQYVGAWTTKLSVQLWFDVSQELAPEFWTVMDVRELTRRVAYFITPRKDPDDPNQLIPPMVRFTWGTFRFDGMVDSMEETLELFSSDGRPLRASVALMISQQKITEFAFNKGAAGFTPPNRPAAGTQQLTAAPAGATLQSMAGDRDWQTIAAANGIENPRNLPVGKLLDLNRSKPRNPLE